MPRELDRKQSSQKNRSRAEPRQPDHSELQKTVEELERQLQQKDILLAKGAERLKRDFGVDVTLDERRRSRSPIRPPMPPAENKSRKEKRRNREDRNSRHTSSPILIDSPEQPYVPDEQFAFEDHDPRYSFERPPLMSGARPVFVAPPTYSPYDPPSHVPYLDEIRVEEMPKWPMDGSPSRDGPSQIFQRASFSPLWRNQEDVQIEPLPVFPMNGVVEEPRRSNKDRRSPPISRKRTSDPLNREMKAQKQMRMIVQQAQVSDIRAKEDEKYRHEKRKREEKEQQEARDKIKMLRDKAKDDLKQKEIRRREKARKKRHAEQEKQEEEERRKGSRRHSPTSNRTNQSSSQRRSKFEHFEGDEKFMEYMTSVFGKSHCEATRNEKIKNDDYKATCHVDNIPKELLCGTFSSRYRSDAREGAVCNFVDKLVELGVFENKFRELMSRRRTFRKFMAEFIESLCNDIAIFGTQISVTNDPHMKDKFLSFAKEKCSEFWNDPNNCERLRDFMQSNMGSLTQHTSRKDQNSKRVSRSPSSSSSIEIVFASNGASGQQPTSSNFAQPARPPSLMAIPLAPPINPYSQNQYQQPMMNGYPPLMQHLLPVPGFHQAGYQNDADLMDEIFT